MFLCAATRPGAVLRRFRLSKPVAGLLLATALLFSLVLPVFHPNVYRTAQLASVAVDVSDGSGSGFVIQRRNANGDLRLFVITANHVMEPAITEARIKFYVRNFRYELIGEIRLNAKLVARLETIDIAVLLIETDEKFFSRIEWDTHTPQPGEKIFSVGSPHRGEHDNSISEGIVSQIGFNFHEEVRAWTVIDQMTAPVNPGNSGGPVFNQANGRVVGIAVGTEGNGINFFVPVRAVREAAADADLWWIVENVTCPSDKELSQRALDLSYE